VEVLIAILAGVLLAVVFVVISAPLRTARSAASAGEPTEAEQARRPAVRDGYERDELEAARETKYREIRDAELDLRTGKLSREDYEAIDGGLRAEALELLDRLEAVEGTRSGGAASSGKSIDPDKAKPKLEG
jgi:hypothetical protein